jgi:hypothetical protein
MDPYSNQSYGYGYGQQTNNYESGSYYKGQSASSFPLPGSSSSSQPAPVLANAYEYDVGILAQQSVYVPGAAIDKRGGAGGKLAKGGKRTTVLRKGAGKVWEDQTLLEWSPCMFPPLLSTAAGSHEFLQHGSVYLLAISAMMCLTTCYQTHLINTLLSRKLVSFGIASAQR